jgi:hypothetical protein
VRALGHRPAAPRRKGFVDIIGFRDTDPKPLTLPSPRKRGEADKRRDRRKSKEHNPCA